MGEVKVLGLYSSFPCVRVLWALKLKGVTYELVEEDLTNKSPLLLQMNPVHKKVPVLIHENKPIAESLVILEYIDETWKTSYSLMPEDPYDCATARFWAKFVDEKVCVHYILLYHLCCLQSMQLVRYFGLLDLVVGWISLWLAAMEEVGGMKLLDSVRFPSLSEWIHNFFNVPVIHECLPPKESAVNYFQSGLNYLRSLEALKN